MRPQQSKHAQPAAGSPLPPVQLLDWARGISMQASLRSKGIAQSVLIEYEGAPHGLFATEKARLTKDLLAFLAH